MNRRYTAEFKKKVVKLVEEGASSSGVAADHQLSYNTLHTWLRQAKTNPAALEVATESRKRKGKEASVNSEESSTSYVNTVDELLKLKKRVNELETENYRLQKLNNILLDKVI